MVRHSKRNVNVSQQIDENKVFAKVVYQFAGGCGARFSLHWTEKFNGVDEEIEIMDWFDMGDNGENVGSRPYVYVAEYLSKEHILIENGIYTP